jgi:hypothetical protein
MKKYNLPTQSQSSARMPAKLVAVLIGMMSSAGSAAAMTCKLEGSEVLLDVLPSDDVMTKIGLKPAKAKPGDEGKYRLAQKDGKLILVTTDGNKICRLSLDGVAATAPTDGKDNTTDKTPKPSAPAVITNNNPILDDYSYDLAVPSSPAFTLIGVDPIQAATPRTPKDIAAQIVQGRGADGRIKQGVAIDTTIFQLARILGLRDEKSADDAQLKAVKNRIGTENGMNITNSFIGMKEKEELNNSHIVSNRLKISIATTSDQEPTTTTTKSGVVESKNAADIAFGLHYAIRDDADRRTQQCNMDNSRDEETLKAIAKLLGEGKYMPPYSTSIKPKMLQQLVITPDKVAGYEALSDDDKVSLKKLVAKACSLTTLEKLMAVSSMAGWAHSYRLVDGGWSTREIGTTGYWLTHAFKGTQISSREAVFQPVVHVRYFLNQRIQVAAPTPAAASAAQATPSTVTRIQDYWLMAVRLRLAVPEGAASFEYSHAQNKYASGKETLKRRAFAFQYKISPGVWLVASAGKETSSLGGSRSSPFVLTNLRFGANQ